CPGMDRKQVRTALAQLGFQLDLDDTLDLMKKHAPPAEVAAITKAKEKDSLHLAPRRAAALLLRKFNSSAPPHRWTSPPTHPAPASSSVEKLREWLDSLDTSVHSLQSDSRRVIRANGEELGVLHLQLQGMRQKLLRRQGQPLPQPLVGTQLEGEQLQGATYEVFLLRRKVDGVREANKRMKQTLVEIEREIDERNGWNDEESAAEREAAGLAGAIAGAEERLERAQGEVSVLKHMAVRLRGQVAELTPMREKVETEMARERLRVQRLRGQLEDASRIANEAEERARGKGKEMAASHGEARSKVEAHEAMLASTQRAVAELELSQLMRHATPRLAEIGTEEDVACACSMTGNGGLLQEVSGPGAQLAAWRRVRKKAWLRHPSELLQQAQVQQAFSRQLGAMLGQARGRLHDVRAARRDLEARVGRVKQASYDAADKRLSQLREAVGEAAQALADAKRAREPTLTAIRDSRERIGKLATVSLRGSGGEGGWVWVGGGGRCELKHGGDVWCAGVERARL
ncbi:MAG: hypothetical protein SGPRY_014793, partial [Prymnesium sp.]